jgi:nicotinamidase-related amidase
LRNRDAYSGFDMGVTKLQWNAKAGYEVAPWAETLLEVLRKHQIKTLRIVGLVTEVCVTANALDALDQGFDIELVEDGIRWLSKEGHEKALRDLSSLDGTPNHQGKIQSVKITL